MKFTQIGGPVTEEGQQNLVGASHLQGQGNTHRGGNSAADHPGCAQVAAGNISDVH